METVLGSFKVKAETRSTARSTVMRCLTMASYDHHTTERHVMAKKVAVTKPVEKKAKHEYDLPVISECGKTLERIAKDLEAAKAFEAAKRTTKVADWCAKVAGRDAERKATKLAKLLAQLEAAGISPQDLVEAAGSR